ncbi:hypothetical protein GYMLUDRAFT_42030 [Collybiopsis luxurians FD-317 M1]|uniref:Uncharacterized protein n=1 Tax=Collybiopsis luxurians FD-317 M1 TaxID=944289 RepID=A0A0D0C386_9AGAR|nr:hypothetical protein GYMLUDRAFT_42030 [Collybiopsis luxurians FD-317 M1]
MVPAWDVESFAEENAKTHTWKHLPMSLPAELPENHRERAKVLFNLLNPVDSPHWEDYIKYRLTAEKRTENMMEAMAGDYMDSYIANIRKAVEDALSDAADESDEEQWMKIADGFSVITCDAEEGMDYGI